MKSQHKSGNKGWIIAFWLYFLLLVGISVSAYLRILPPQLTAHDKLGHFILLGTASFLSHQALGRKMIATPVVKMPLGPVLITILAFIDENTQVLSAARSYSMTDLAANWIGIWVFYWIGEQVRKLNSDS
ncbi:MAG: VanZ family protein [Hormoscilla sp.]